MSAESVIRASTEGFSISDQRKAVVEIGMGEDPFIYFVRRRAAYGITYTGIDNRFSGLAFFKDPFPEAERKLRKVPGLDFELRDGNGEATHLPDHSVDLVHFSNVFGDGNVLKNKILLVKEAARIIRQSGTLRVVETITPDFFPLPEIRRLAMAVGFFQKNRGRETDLEALRKYLPFDAYLDRDSYMAEFRPVPNRQVFA